MVGDSSLYSHLHAHKMPKAKTTKRSERIAGEDSGSKRGKEAASSSPVVLVSADMLGTRESAVELAADSGVKRLRWSNCCFTINNPRVLADGKFEPLVLSLPERCSYIVWSLEKGENGTPHYQGYLELKKQIESPGVS